MQLCTYFEAVILEQSSDTFGEMTSTYRVVVSGEGNDGGIPSAAGVARRSFNLLSQVRGMVDADKNRPGLPPALPCHACQPHGEQDVQPRNASAEPR